MSEPRRHHFVQRAYLDRFAKNGQLHVRRRDGRSFRASSANIAVETGLYDVTDASGNRSTAVETHLGEIEGPAMNALSLVDDVGRPPAEDTTERAALARYMALQATRTREERERIFFARRVATYAGPHEVTRELVAEYLEKVHLGFEPSENEAAAAFDFVSVNLSAPETLTQEFAIEMMLQSMDRIAPILRNLHWTLEFDRKGRLITSDAPLVVWRQPSPRDEFEGVRIANAEEIRFPLDPVKQLVLSPRERTATARIEGKRVQDCNPDMASACHRFVVAHPRNSNQANSVQLTPRRPVIRFNTGPLYSPEGEHLAGDVLHTWVPRRQSQR